MKLWPSALFSQVFGFFFWSATASGITSKQDRLNSLTFQPIDQTCQAIYEYLINLKADSFVDILQCFWPLKVERLEQTAVS